MKIIKFLILILLIKCTPDNSSEISRIENIHKKDSSIWHRLTNQHDSSSLKIDQNFLKIDYGKISVFFDLKSAFCKRDKDTIIMIFQRGVGPVDVLTIKVINDLYKIKFESINEDLVNSYISSFQSLSLDLNIDKTKDSAVVFLIYNGILNDSVAKINDTIKISGNFKIKIHKDNYNYDSLKFEIDSLTMLKILKTERPDTIFEINFARCGLRKIPKELENFKNLQYLTLDINDLSDENFILLEKLPNLKLISLSRCNIAIFPLKILNLRKIEEIDLTHNLITKVPYEIYNKKNLKVINLSYNKLLDSTKVKLDNKGRIKEISLGGTK